MYISAEISKCCIQSFEELHAAREPQFDQSCSIQIYCFKKHSVRYELCFEKYLIE